MFLPKVHLYYNSPAPGPTPSLKRRPGRLPTGSLLLRQHIIRALLHLHLPLHLLHLLLLGKRQRPRHAQQQRARAQHPQRLAAEGQARGRPRRGGAQRVAEGFAGLGRDDVFQRGQAVEERLVGDVV